jgi:UDP-N-acetylglucosamine 2-epimerase (non-hydrolysing)
MVDSLLSFQEKAESSTILDRLGLRTRAAANGTGDCISPYAVLTLHRPSNVDRREAFLRILEGLEELAARCPVIFPAHPRARKRIAEFGLKSYFSSNHRKQELDGSRSYSAINGIRLIEPLGYLDFLCLMKHAVLVLTDSGGIQEETTCLGIPCVTLRKNTERPITVKNGTNVLAGTQKEKIRNAIQYQLAQRPNNGAPEKWDGKTAGRILQALVNGSSKRERSRKSPSLMSTPHMSG